MTSQIRSLLDAATPGPWTAEAIGSEGYHIMRHSMGLARRRMRLAALTHEQWDTDKANAALIVALVNAAPFLLDVVDAARRIHAEHMEVARLLDEAEPPCICGPYLAALDKHLEGQK